MKINKTPTKHILIEAKTFSVNNVVNYAILDITDEFLEILRLAYYLNSEMELYKVYNNFESATYALDIKATFVNIDDNDLAGLSDHLEEFQYITLKDNEIFTLQIPDEGVECLKLIVNKNNTFNIKGTGEYSCTDYWTEDIVLNNIINETTR